MPQKWYQPRPEWLLGLFALVFYLAGFYYDENSSGGSRADSLFYHYPAVRYFAAVPIGTAIKDYSSASGPLFYIAQAYLNPLIDNEYLYRLSNILLAFVTIALVYLALRSRFPQTTSTSLCLLTATIVVSPYMKSSAIWGTNENLPILLIVVAAMAFSYAIRNSSLLAGVLTISAAVLAGLTRQYYVVFAAYFTTRLALHEVQTSLLRTGWILLIALLCASPFLFSLTNWGGLTPPSFQHQSAISANSLPYMFSFLAFYLAPLAWFLRTSVSRFLDFSASDGLYRVFILLPLAIYLSVCWDFDFYGADHGGGAIAKAVGNFVAPSFPTGARLLFIGVGACGLMMLVWLISISRQNIVVGLTVAFLIATPYQFQKYIDPLLNVVLLLLADYGTHTKRLFGTVAFPRLLFVYNLGFYVVAAVYYNALSVS